MQKYNNEKKERIKAEAELQGLINQLHLKKDENVRLEDELNEYNKEFQALNDRHKEEISKNRQNQDQKLKFQEKTIKELDNEKIGIQIKIKNARKQNEEELEKIKEKHSKDLDILEQSIRSTLDKKDKTIDNIKE